MERLQTGQDRSSTSKVNRLNTVPAGQRYAMVMPSYFSSLSMFNAKKPSPYHHDMQGKTILAFRRIVLKKHASGQMQPYIRPLSEDILWSSGPDEICASSPDHDRGLTGPVPHQGLRKSV